MKTLFEYVMTPGWPAASRPASRTRAADAVRSSRSAPRACNSTAASVTSSATPSRARLSARRMEFAVGPVPGVAEVVILRAYDRVDQALQGLAGFLARGRPSRGAAGAGGSRRDGAGVRVEQGPPGRPGAGPAPAPRPSARGETARSLSRAPRSLPNTPPAG